MNKINAGRVILGGLIAGVIIDIVAGVMDGIIFSDQWAAAMKAIGRPGTLSVKQIVASNVLGLAIGILAVWLYAAIRPRFGPGPKTALRAGCAVWLLVYAISSAPLAFLHIFPLGLELAVTAIGLVEVLVATLAGAYFYKEA